MGVLPQSHQGQVNGWIGRVALDLFFQSLPGLVGLALHHVKSGEVGDRQQILRVFLERGLEGFAGLDFVTRFEQHLAAQIKGRGRFGLLALQGLNRRQCRWILISQDAGVDQLHIGFAVFRTGRNALQCLNTGIDVALGQICQGQGQLHRWVVAVQFASSCQQHIRTLGIALQQTGLRCDQQNLGQGVGRAQQRRQGGGGLLGFALGQVSA